MQIKCGSYMTLHRIVHESTFCYIYFSQPPNIKMILFTEFINVYSSYRVYNNYMHAHICYTVTSYLIILLYCMQLIDAVLSASLSIFRSRRLKKVFEVISYTVDPLSITGTCMSCLECLCFLIGYSVYSGTSK